jgi:hypothetical protein
VNEQDLDSLSYTHFHEWRVVARVGGRAVVSHDQWKDTGPMLLLWCGCGMVGMVVDPSLAEVRRAAKPYRWFAHHRIQLIGVSQEIQRPSEEQT